MRWFHLTWDADVKKHPNVPADVAELLCNKPFNVKKIGRPIESTIVFCMEESEGDICSLYNALTQKFKSSFNCIVSRVETVTHGDGKLYFYAKGAGMKSEHEDPFGEILVHLKSSGKIPQNVQNVNVKW